MSQNHIVGSDRAQARTIVRSRGSCMGMVHCNYVEQRLLTIRFSPAIRFSLEILFYKPTSGVIVNNNKYWLSLNFYGLVWILEHSTREQPRFKSWGGGAIQAKPESGVRSAWDLRAKPSGEGLSEPLPRNFLEFRTSNRYIWCMVEREILSENGGQ